MSDLRDSQDAQDTPAAAEIIIGLLVDAGTLIVVGEASSAVADSAELGFPTMPNASGRWRAMNWPNSSGGVRFLAVVSADNVLRAQAGGLVLQAEAGRSALPDAGRIEVEFGELMTVLRENEIEMGSAFEFLRRALVSSRAQVSPTIWRFLFAMLSSISKQDGFVEILGTVEGGGLLLQGWSVHLPPGALDLGVLAGGFEIGRATVATFERPDLPATARGLVAFAPGLNVDPGAVQRIHFRAGDSYLHLDVVERRLILGPTETIGHLRDVQGKLNGDAAVIAGLRRLCRPRFAGVDTVTDLPQPVRIATDLALHADGAGIFVSGWLLDPRRLVREVTLRTGSGRVIGRIDTDWVRLPRADVTQGFTKDPLFAGDLARTHDHRHGFMTFAPFEGAIAGEDTAYLELGMGDDLCAFAPLRLERPEPGAVLSRLLGSVNVDDPAIEEIISRHLGPLAAALCAARHGSGEAPGITGFGDRRAHPAVSVVMPLPPEFKDLDVNLAQFAGDPDFADCEFVIVAPRAGGESAAATLKRSASFYGVRGTLVLTDRAHDRFEAMELGVAQARAEHVLFLLPSILPRRRGWLGQLRRAQAQLPTPGIVSPTLLYEDESIRFAGSARPPAESAIAALGRFAGYPHHWLEGSKLAPVWAGTMECALMPKKLFEACGGFSRVLLGPEFKNADFALSARAQGQRAYWLPEVALYALDDPEPSVGGDYWTKVRALVDRWAFRRQWSEIIAA
jgi:O-antigen biosynthesis protein